MQQTEIAIYGTILISFFALLINFFFSLNQFLNTYLIIIPLFFLIKYKFLKKEDFFFLLISSISVCLLIAYSSINNPDAGLYHLPFIQILNENKIIFGLSNLHFRFGHVSILQYLSAINFNLITGTNGILIPVACLVVYIYLYFINEINNFIKSNVKISLNDLFSFFILIYISYKINRYSGFGNDAVAHLLLFYLISIYLKSNNDYSSLKKTALISSYIFLNKATLLLVFLFPFLIFYKNIKKHFKILYSFAFFFVALWLIKNVITSSCLIFPVEKSCLNNLYWSNHIEIQKQSISSEAWAKGWPDRIDKNINQQEFLKNFNWLNAWYTIHFQKVLKILIPFIVFISVFIILININSKKRESIKSNFFNEKFKILSTVSILILGNILFFLKFPLYRYGYSYLISLISIGAALLIFSYNNELIKKIFKYMIIFSIIIVSLKQLSRIYVNYNERNVWPSIVNFSEQSAEKKNYLKKIIGENFKIYTSDTECMYKKPLCTNINIDNLSHKKFLIFDVIFAKK